MIYQTLTEIGKRSSQRRDGCLAQDVRTTVSLTEKRGSKIDVDDYRDRSGYDRFPAVRRDDESILCCLVLLQLRRAVQDDAQSRRRQKVHTGRRLYCHLLVCLVAFARSACVDQARRAALLTRIDSIALGLRRTAARRLSALVLIDHERIVILGREGPVLWRVSSLEFGVGRVR